MYEYKKGFTLIEVILVVGMMVTMFSMAIGTLSSFSNINKKYIEKDFNETRSLFEQVKYLKFLGEQDFTIECNAGKVSLSLDNKIISEKHFSTLSCDGSLMFSSGSSTFEAKINQYGYVTFERI